jgi:flagellar motor switch protein FliM
MPEDILSQNVIDSLLAQAMGESEAAGAVKERFRSIRAYDFRHPSKLSKEQLRAIQLVFESFARSVTHNLSTMMRSTSHVALVSVQQAVFDEYARGLPATTLLNIFSAPPLPGTLVLEYDLDTAFVMLDRVLGGTGVAATHSGEVTDIEDELLQSISGLFMAAFSESWQHIVPLQARLLRLEYSARFLQIAPVNEPVVLLLFDLRVLNRQTTVSLCIPYSVLEPIAAELNVQTVYAAGPKDAESGVDTSEVQQRLQRVTVPVTAMLGSTDLPLGDVINLEVNDVIRLDGFANDPLIVAVNKKPTFFARPGMARLGIGVQILGVMPDEITQ